MSTIEISMIEELKKVLESHKDVRENLSREDLITKAVENKDAVVTPNGALATWTPSNSTGRSPKDTYIVRNPESESNIDWTSNGRQTTAPRPLWPVSLQSAYTVAGLDCSGCCSSSKA